MISRAACGAVTVGIAAQKQVGVGKDEQLEPNEASQPRRPETLFAEGLESQAGSTEVGTRAHC